MNTEAGEWEVWDRCYDDSWRGDIVDDAFSHPAKMARGLLARIIDEGLKAGYWKPGDRVGDPFGGIGTTGLLGAYAGLCVVCVELEPRFVELAKTNFDLHWRRWYALGDPMPTILQGDSREFARLVGGCDGIVTSPPWMEDGICKSNTHTGNKVNRNQQCVSRGRPEHIGGDQQAEQISYGTTAGQIGRLPAGDLDSIITSPPYAETATEKNSPSVDRRKQYETYRAAGGGASFEAFCATQAKHSTGYGASLGQIGTLREGDLDAVITSPPYNLPMSQEHPGRSGGERGTTPSEPGAFVKYGNAEGQIEGLPPGDLDSIITSPPYADGLGHGGEYKEVGAGGHKNKQAQVEGYGTTPGNLGNLAEGRLDAVVTSPPWENQEPSHAQADTPSKARMNEHVLSGRAALNAEYGDSPGQLGNTTGETYWQAVAQVYRECHKALKPGGVLCVVVKGYVKKGAYVDLPNQTATLLDALGFVVFRRVKAMLVHEEVYDGLFEQVKKRKERKSFFRRLAEKKGSPPIDFEAVLFARRS